MNEARVFLPLSLVERVAGQLEDAARETGWESLAVDAAELRRLLETQFPPQPREDA